MTLILFYVAFMIGGDLAACLACLLNTNGASKRACSFSWPSISYFSGSRGCSQFG